MTRILSPRFAVKTILDDFLKEATALEGAEADDQAAVWWWVTTLDRAESAGWYSRALDSVHCYLASRPNYRHVILLTTQEPTCQQDDVSVCPKVKLTLDISLNLFLAISLDLCLDLNLCLDLSLAYA